MLINVLSCYLYRFSATIKYNEAFQGTTTHLRKLHEFFLCFPKAFINFVFVKDKVLMLIGTAMARKICEEEDLANNLLIVFDSNEVFLFELIFNVPLQKILFMLLQN